MAKANTPLILSTGMCSFGEVQRSVSAIKEAGCEKLVLLQCTSNYPAPEEDTHLRVMNLYQKEFDVPVWEDRPDESLPIFEIPIRHGLGIPPSQILIFDISIWDMMTNL